jgi:hypothetical protein
MGANSQLHFGIILNRLFVEGKSLKRKPMTWAVAASIATVMAAGLAYWQFFTTTSRAETNSDSNPGANQPSSRNESFSDGGKDHSQHVVGNGSSPSSDDHSITAESTSGDGGVSVSSGKTEFLQVFPPATDAKPKAREPNEQVPSGVRFMQGDQVHGSLFVLTENTPNNQLLKHNVGCIAPVKDDSVSHEYLYVGELRAEGRMQRVVEKSTPVIESVVVVVSAFKPMEPVIPQYAGMVNLPGVEVAYLLEKKDAPLPWVFEPAFCRYVKKGQKDQPDFEPGNGFFPKVLTDSDPNFLRAWFTAKDPGIYWVNCKVVVRDGAHENSTQTFKLLKKPIPIAFFGAGDERPPAAAKSGDWKLIGPEKK